MDKRSRLLRFAAPAIAIMLAAALVPPAAFADDDGGQAMAPSSALPARFDLRDQGVEVDEANGGEQLDALLAKRTPQIAVLDVMVNPSGTLATASRWLIHTVCSSGVPSSRRDGAPRVIVAGPYSPASVCPTTPPRSTAMICCP